MGCFVKPYKWGGWFTAEGSQFRGRQLQRRLEDRLENTKGLVITLTTDWSRSGEEQYDEIQRNKAVSRFFTALNNLLEVDCRGKWICKLEFTDEGYPHFHIILVGVTYISHSALERAWGRGFVWVKRYSHKNSDKVSRYVGKSLAGYIGKELNLPGWVNERPTGSIKVIRTSPGFWGVPSRASSVNVDGKLAATEVASYDNGLPCFVPIGYKRVQSGLRVELSDDLSKRRVTFEGINLGSVAVYLARDGHTFDYDNGQLHTSATFEQTLEAAARAARRRRPLHLNKVLNRAWVVEALASR